jgi:hypothetical protein
MVPPGAEILSVDPFGHRTSPSTDTGFLVLAAFLCSFLFIRTSARLMRSPRVRWWPGSVVTEGGLHIHHLVWGIVLMMVSGFLAFAVDLASPWWQIAAGAFGVGAGLAMDEFALWLRLRDVYWSAQGRASLDGVVVASMFGALVVLGTQPFGLNEPASVLGTCGTVAATMGLAAVCFLKGRLALGVLAIFVPFAGILGAIRLGQPDSPWARWRYRGRRAKALQRARARFDPTRRRARLERRLGDLIAGAPSGPQGSETSHGEVYPRS